MARDRFPSGVAEELKWYAYRLIDPRNGETFYVGKGRADRIFAHAKGSLDTNPQDGGLKEVSDPKLQRIREIQASGMEVAHVVHRHGIDSERIAFEIEAALIDAYPGLTNQVRGQGTRDYGSRHVEEIIAEYAGNEFEVKEPLMLISIGRTYYERPVYDAVRTAWRINKNKVQSYKLVLANLRGLVVGAFRPEQWLPATIENFPGIETRNHPGRHGFIGHEAEPEVRNYYLRKRVPARYRRRGAQSSVRYCHPDDV